MKSNAALTHVSTATRKTLGHHDKCDHIWAFLFIEFSYSQIKLDFRILIKWGRLG